MDSAKNPVSGVSYEFAGVDGKVERGCLWTYGIIRRTGLPEAGTCSVVLLSVHGAKWSKSEAQVGDVVKLSAEVEGYEDGTRAVLEIWERDLNGADQCLDTLEARVSGKKVEAEWTYRFREDSDDYIAEEDEKPGYSDPEYYFIVTVGNDRARSAHLRYQDWIEVELKDEDDNVMSDEEFIVFISNGEIRKGKLDKNGYKKIEKLPPRPWQIIFPNINPGN